MPASQCIKSWYCATNFVGNRGTVSWRWRVVPAQVGWRPVRLRRIAWRAMISKKFSTMLSQLPLASPVVPGERGRHLHRYRRQVAGRGGCVVVPTAGARLARCPYSLLTPSSGPYFWEWSHAGPPSSRTPWSTCLILKDVRRATCPLDARVPVNAAGGSYGNWACPRFFRRPRAAGTIGRRSAFGTVNDRN